jgi:hypothetical protein
MLIKSQLINLKKLEIKSNEKIEVNHLTRYIPLNIKSTKAPIPELFKNIEGRIIHTLPSDIGKAKIHTRQMRDEDLIKSIKGQTLVIDEASMCGSANMRELLKICQKYEMTPVFSGDKMQLASVAFGRDFARFQEAGITTALLTHIRRQKDQDLLQFAMKLAEDKNVGTALNILQEAHKQEVEKGVPPEKMSARITEEPDSRKSIGQASKEYVQDYKEALAQVARGEEKVKSTLILTTGNSRREQINAQIRFYLKKEGVLAGPEYKIKIHGHEGGEPDRGFSVNDKIIFLKNAEKEVGVLNNQTATIQDIRMDEGGTVDKIKVKMDDGRSLSFNPKKYNYFDHGYCITVHKSQGATVDKVIAEFSTRQKNNYNLIYVALSRSRHQVSLYVNDLKKFIEQGNRIENKKSAEDEIAKKLEKGRNIAESAEKIKGFSPIVQEVLIAENKLWLRQNQIRDTTFVDVPESTQKLLHAKFRGNNAEYKRQLNLAKEELQKETLKARLAESVKDFEKELQQIAINKNLSGEFARDCAGYFDRIKRDYFAQANSNDKLKLPDMEKKGAEIGRLIDKDLSRPASYIELAQAKHELLEQSRLISSEKRTQAASLAAGGAALSPEQSAAFVVRYKEAERRYLAAVDQIIERQAKDSPQAEQIRAEIEKHAAAEKAIRIERNVMVAEHGGIFRNLPREDQAAILARYEQNDKTLEDALRLIERGAGAEPRHQTASDVQAVATDKTRTAETPEAHRAGEQPAQAPPPDFVPAPATQEQMEAVKARIGEYLDEKQKFEAGEIAEKPSLKPIVDEARFMKRREVEQAFKEFKEENPDQKLGWTQGKTLTWLEGAQENDKGFHIDCKADAKEFLQKVEYDKLCTERTLERSLMGSPNPLWSNKMLERLEGGRVYIESAGLDEKTLEAVKKEVRDSKATLILDGKPQKEIIIKAEVKYKESVQVMKERLKPNTEKKIEPQKAVKKEVKTQERIDTGLSRSVNKAAQTNGKQNVICVSDSGNEQAVTQKTGVACVSAQKLLEQAQAGTDLKDKTLIVHDPHKMRTEDLEKMAKVVEDNQMKVEIKYSPDRQSQQVKEKVTNYAKDHVVSSAKGYVRQKADEAVRSVSPEVQKAINKVRKIRAIVNIVKSVSQLKKRLAFITAQAEAKRSARVASQKLLKKASDTLSKKNGTSVSATSTNATVGKMGTEVSKKAVEQTGTAIREVASNVAETTAKAVASATVVYNVYKGLRMAKDVLNRLSGGTPKEEQKQSTSLSRG